MLTALLIIGIVALLLLETYWYSTQINVVLDVALDHDYGFHILAMQMLLPTKSNIIRNSNTVMKDVFVDIRTKKAYRVVFGKLLNNYYEDSGFSEGYTTVRQGLINHDKRRTALFEKLKIKTGLDHRFDDVKSHNGAIRYFEGAFDPNNPHMNKPSTVIVNSFSYSYYTVTCIDDKSQIAWSRKMNNRYEQGLCRSFIFNDQVFVISMKLVMDLTFRNFKIHCFDIKTGKTIWTKAI